MTCRNCIFSMFEQPPEGEPFFHCRRDAPKMFHIGDSLLTLFPRMKGSGWCGSHRYSIWKLVKRLLTKEKS